jgi:subtilisin family serine protease
LFQEQLAEYIVYAHGTHVAGVALRGNPAARMLVARIGAHPGNDEFKRPPRAPTLENARSFARELRETIEYFRQHDVRVVNMSWHLNPQRYEARLAANNLGTQEERRKLARQIFDTAATALHEAMVGAPGILFVVAAGNKDEDNTFTENVPAGWDLPNLITVGAVDGAGDEWALTSYGKVDLYANGYQVPSRVPGGAVIAFSGTSDAAPQVVNLAAKLWAAYPRLSMAEVKKRILEGADAKDVSGGRMIRLLNEARSFELARATR